jgi:hypothetical protein
MGLAAIVQGKRYAAIEQDDGPLSGGQLNWDKMAI